MVAPRQTKPQNGYGEWTDSEGTYKGEWRDGKHHGKGAMLYAEGVRYDGEFFRGKVHGIGTWSFERKAPPPAPKARDLGGVRCTFPQHLQERRVVQPIAYSTFLRPTWPPGRRTAEQRKALGADVARWWPDPPKDLAGKIAQSPGFALDFFRRVLARDSRAQVAAVTELPLGARALADPQLDWTIGGACQKTTPPGRGSPAATAQRIVQRSAGRVARSSAR